MSRIRASLAAATVVALPALSVPAQAFPIDWGCTFVAVRDPVEGNNDTEIWNGLTASYFVGTPDVVHARVTCWLQSAPDYGPGSPAEIPDTRHTCETLVGTATCANDMVFHLDTGDDLYLCQHVSWTGSVTHDPTHLPADLSSHLIRDIFSTGGVTTLGGPGDIVATIARAFDNLVATLTSIDPATYLEQTPATHTVTPDFDDSSPGIQCAPTL